jgi:hypothetical protein
MILAGWISTLLLKFRIFPKDIMPKPLSLHFVRDEGIAVWMKIYFYILKRY